MYEQIISSVRQALSTVIDPDFKKDLVTLNMVKDIHVEDNIIHCTIELTTPACPLKEQLEQESKSAIHNMVGSEYDVAILFTSKVTTLRDIKSEVLQGVKNIIVVASGKGGVGKSTVSVNLALTLSQSGASVGIMDADIYGPSIPTMLGLKGKRPSLQKVEDKHKIVPVLYNDIKVMSIGFLIEEKQAVVWRGAMVTSALRQFVTDVLWEDLDYLVIDMPPGTGDIHLTLAQLVPVTGAIIVTTPQEVALADARKALSMFKLEQINIPILGVVENMAYFIPPDMPEKRYAIFGEGGAQLLTREYDTEVLGQIPIEIPIRKGGDEGMPAVLWHENDAFATFNHLAKNIARKIAINNASLHSVESTA
jgi:ATP-binding protein involved in chromosome partitioning